MMSHVNYYHGSASNADSGVIGANGGHPRLIAINVNKGAASAVVTVYNGASAAGSVVATIDASAASSHWYGGIRCPNGLEVVQSGGASDFTVSYV